MFEDSNIICESCTYSIDANEHMFSIAYFNYIRCLRYRSYVYKAKTEFEKNDAAYIQHNCGYYIYNSKQPILRRLVGV